MLVKRIKESQGPLVIVLPQSQHHSVLAQLKAEKIIKPIQLLSKEDLIEKVFFAFHPLALYHASKYMGLKPAVVRPWLQYLYYVDLNAQYTSSTLQQLFDLKQHLVEVQMIHDFQYKDYFFSANQVIIQGYDDDPWMTPLLNHLKHWTKVDVLEKPWQDFKPATFVQCDTVYDEIVHQCIQVQRWLDSGVSMTSIKMIEPPESYITSLKMVATLFGLPLQFNARKTLMEYPIVHAFLKHLKHRPNQSLLVAFQESLSVVNQTDFMQEKVIQILMRTINPLIVLEDNIDLIYDYLTHIFSKTTVPQPQYKEAIEVISVDDYRPSKTDYLIYMSASLGHFPITQTEHDLLSADEKACLNIPTAQTVNQSRIQHLKRVYNGVYKATFSVASKNNQTVFYTSNIIEEWLLKYPISQEQPYHYDDQDVAPTIDKLYAKKLYDQWRMYQVSHRDLITYYAYFKTELDIYNPQFKPLQETTLNALIKTPLSLSYTTLNNFFGCQFKYLASALLRLDSGQTNLSLELGQLVHDLLDCWSKTGEITDDLIDQKIDQMILIRQRSNSETYILKRMNTQVKNIIEAIQNQRDLMYYETFSSEIKLQKSYAPEYPVILKGVIDQVLCDDNQAMKACVLIDYKTGKPTLDLKKGVFGMQVQLLYYCLLWFNQYPDTKITGFYEQSVLHEPLKHDKSFDQVMKLQGYTIDDIHSVNQLFKDVKQSGIVQGLNVNKDQMFFKNSKVYNVDQLTQMINYLENKIKSAIQSIFAGEFTINPIRVQNTDISCQYCQFTDLCYRDYRHYRNLHLNEDLMSHVGKGGE